MSTETTQINARIDRALKERGDAALERAGYSPSQAIRKLWDFAARNAHSPHVIQAFFDTKDEAEEREAKERRSEEERKAEEERARRREFAIKGANIVAEAYERYGIEPSDWAKNASYEEMRDYALLERLRERGLDG